MKSKIVSVLFVTVPSLLLLGTISGIGWYKFNAPSSLFHFVKGEKIFVNPVVAIVSTDSTELNTTASFRIVNMNSTPVKIMNVHSDCSCVLTKKLPDLIQPWQFQDFEVSMSYEHQKETKDQNITLFINDGRTLTVPLIIRGKSSS